MDLTQGVTPGESPTGTEDVAVDSSPTTQAVSADSAPVADRSPEQMFRELQRKYDQQARTQEQILQYLQSVNTTPKAAPVAPQSRDLTDEDLWALAQQGDRSAFELYQKRIAERTYAERQQVQNRTGIVDNQLRALFARYPILRDPQHALTQAVNGAYALYIQNGYAPGKDTMLMAATAAITDNPEIIASMQGAPSATREVSRQTAVNARQAGVTGVTHRQTPATGGTKKPLTKEEVELAKRMGVTDPAGAKERFLKRNAEGQSSLGAVGGYVNQEDF